MEKMLVKKFFDNAQRYLNNNSENINIRKLILGDMLKSINKDRILDVGCGDGSISIPLLDNDNQLTLLDFSHEMLKLAKLNVKEKYSKSIEMIKSRFNGLRYK